jgi:hypothetical protein
VVSERFTAFVERTFPPAKARALLDAVAAVDFGAPYFGGQDPERLALAMALLHTRNPSLRVVVELAFTDWRDLLMAGDLGHGGWERKMDAILDPAAGEATGP